MGITNLLQILKSITNKRHLKDFANKKLAIDAYVWLHKSTYTIIDILDNPHSTEYLKYLTKCVDHLLQFRINPIFVFDGDKLPMKEITEKQRENQRESRTKEVDDCLKRNDYAQAQKKKIQSMDVNPQMAKEFIKILKQKRIEYIVAPYEADVQLAYLSKINYVHGVITEDSDLLAFGCKRVLFKLDFQSSICDEILYDDIKKTDGYDFSSFNYDKFVSFCILCGCDYFKMKGVGPKSAYRALRDSTNYKEAFALLSKKGSQCEKDCDEEFEKAFLAFHFQVVYCPIEKKTKYFNDMNIMNYPFMTKITDYSFLGTIYDDDTSQKIACGDINPITHLPFETNENTQQNGLNFCLDKLQSKKPINGKKAIAKGKECGLMKPGKKEYNFCLGQSKLPFQLKENNKKEEAHPNTTILLKGTYVPTISSNHDSTSTLTTSSGTNVNTQVNQTQRNRRDKTPDNKSMKTSGTKYGYKRKFNEFSQQSKEFNNTQGKENTIENSFQKMKDTINFKSFLSSVYDFHQEPTPNKDIKNDKDCTDDNYTLSNIDHSDEKPPSSSKKSDASLCDYIEQHPSILQTTPIEIKTKSIIKDKESDSITIQHSINRLIQKYTYDPSNSNQIKPIKPIPNLDLGNKEIKFTDYLYKQPKDFKPFN